MCPPGPAPLSDIGPYWTDEELIVFLDRIQHGLPLPSNVVVDVNPSEYRPSDLPDDVWFFVRSCNESEPEIGFWKSTGDDCQIYADSKLTGWRTTLEFYDGPSKDADITDWVMQKYWITTTATSNIKASGYLCRVFPCDRGCRKQKRQRYLEICDVRAQESLFLEDHSGCSIQKGSTKVSEVSVRPGESKESNPGDHMNDTDCFSRGDYLELLDLAYPRSSTSSSDNSSCISMASDEVFDYLSLLNDLEPDNCKENQSNSTTCNLSVSVASVPKEVIVHPAIDGPVKDHFENFGVNVIGSITRKDLTSELQRAGSLVTHVGCQSLGQPLEVEHVLSCSVIEGKPDEESGSRHADQNEKEVVPNCQKASPSQRPVPDEGKRPDNRSAMIHSGQNIKDAERNSHEASTSQGPMPDKGKKTLGKMKMLRMKYLCFMPF